MLNEICDILVDVCFNLNRHFVSIPSFIINEPQLEIHYKQDISLIEKRKKLIKVNNTTNFLISVEGHVITHFIYSMKLIGYETFGCV